MKKWSSLTDREKAIRSFILIPFCFLFLLLPENNPSDSFFWGKIPFTAFMVLMMLVQGIYYARKTTEDFEKQISDWQEQQNVPPTINLSNMEVGGVFIGASIKELKQFGKPDTSESLSRLEFSYSSSGCMFITFNMKTIRAGIFVIRQHYDDYLKPVTINFTSMNGETLQVSENIKYSDILMLLGDIKVVKSEVDETFTYECYFPQHILEIRTEKSGEIIMISLISVSNRRKT